MTVDEMIDALQGAFSTPGVPYPEAKHWYRMEREYGNEAVKFSGLIHTLDGVKCHVFRTSNLLMSCLKRRGVVSDAYFLLVSDVMRGVKALQGAQIAALAGYPMLGFAVSRTEFDLVRRQCAILNGIVTASDALGKVPVEEMTLRAMSNKRNSAQKKIIDWTVGSKSGLSEESQSGLRALNELVNAELHAGALSLGRFLMQDQCVTPKFEIKQFFLCANRLLESHWMWHRLMPLMFLTTDTVPERWSRDWELLDKVFQMHHEPYEADNQSTATPAVAEFVNTKLGFSSADRYDSIASIPDWTG